MCGRCLSTLRVCFAVWRQLAAARTLHTFAQVNDKLVAKQLPLLLPYISDAVRPMACAPSSVLPDTSVALLLSLLLFL